jgi:acetolactate synthase I/II/III large subunit
VRLRLGRPRRPLPGYAPDSAGRRAGIARAQALELIIRAAERPVILAGHGHHPVNATEASSGSSPSATQTPIAMTLLGIGGIPASHPLNLGMMGMHGEAWVNTAIQEADLLLAFGMRFDDRVTGNLKTYAPTPARSTSTSTRPRSARTSRGRGLVGDLRDVLEGCCRRPPATRRVARAHRRPEGRLGGARHQNLPDDGHLYAAHVIHDLWRETGGAPSS